MELICLPALQELLYVFLVRFQLESLLVLTLVKSIAGNWLSGSPIRKRSEDKYVGLQGSSDKAHRGLEIRQASISDNSVQSPS